MLRFLPKVTPSSPSPSEKVLPLQWQWQSPTRWMQQNQMQPQPWGLQPMGAPEYPGLWIQVMPPQSEGHFVPSLNGGQFVGQPNAPIMPIKTVVEVKLESMARAICRTWKKMKDLTSKARQIFGQKPHKIKIRLGRGT